MRKAMSILLMLFLIATFAYATTNSGVFTFKGYYEVPQSTISFEINNSAGNSVLLSYADISDSSLTASTKVFDWTLTGTASNSTAKATVAFKFYPLQALLDGLYCVPAYTITMTKNTTTVGGKAYNNDNFKISGSSSFSVSKQEVESSENPNGFSTPNTITYTGSFKNNQTGTWVRSGSCSIRITDYKSDFVGDFKYTGEVQVTITVN